MHRKIHENTLKTTKTTPKLHQITQKTLLDHPRTRPNFFNFFDFFAPRTASTTSKLTSQNHILRQFLKELHRKIHENTLKTTKTTPKLHQITQKTLLDHPRTRPKIFKIFDFFAPRTASTTSKSTSQNHPVRQFLKELHRKMHENTLKMTKTTPKLHQIT